MISLSFAYYNILYKTLRYGLICCVKVKDRFLSNELRERLGIDDIISVLH